jgi:predicted homoserine dehydrogenase-like protein
MVDKIVRVAVVGGGRTGTPLIEDFLKRPFIDLVGVADVDPDSPGAKVAKDNDVFFTTDAMELAAKNEEIDLLVEVSGDSALKPKIKNHFVARGNKHTIIMHDLIARLVISLISNSSTLTEPFHPLDNGVG